MRAVFVGLDQRIGIRDVPRPVPAADELIVAPLAGGICGTDLHIVKGEFPQAVFPVVPCHEFAGRVVSMGRDVAGFAEGDLVATDPNIACGRCRWCEAGRPNLCAHLAVIGVTRPGAAAEQVAVPARCAHRLPLSLDAGTGALIEPLACACNAVARAGRLRDKRILVLGSGVMGLLIVLVAKQVAPGEIWVADPATPKHAIARAIGADRVVKPDAIGSERFDVIFEASGAQAAAADVMDRLEKMGVWMQVGVLAPTDRIALQPFAVFDREISIIGSNSLADKFPEAVALMPEIADRVAHLVTGRVLVWNFADALDTARAPHSVKTQLTF